MISITCMLIISTIQSSIDKMVPKTSYFKMVDLFLIYSFNIVIVIMGIHTYMDTQINRDDVTGMIVDRSSSASRLFFKRIMSLQQTWPSNNYIHLQPYKQVEEKIFSMILLGSLTRVRPITDESEVSSRVSSARSLVGSMFGGSEVCVIIFSKILNIFPHRIWM